MQHKIEKVFCYIQKKALLRAGNKSERILKNKMKRHFLSVYLGAIQIHYVILGQRPQNDENHSRILYLE